MTVSKRTVALIATAILVLGSGAAIASSTWGNPGDSQNPVSDLLNGTGIGGGSRQCVDSNGENSTDEQLFHSAMQTRYVKYRDGRIYSVEELTQRLGKERTPFLYISDSDYTAAGVEVFGTRTPAGGDAAFASAVCDRPEMWAPEELSESQVDGLAQTPHFLRSLGRTVCKSVRETESFEQYLDPFQQALAQLRLDPAGTKQAAIEEAEQVLARQETQLADLEGYDFIDEDTRRHLRESYEQQLYVTKESLATMREVTNEHMERNALNQVDFIATAVENLCPETSEVGFGPECGTIMYPNSGGAEGKVRLRTGDELSCDDARAVLNNHFATVLHTDSLGRLPDDSPLISIVCETNSTSELIEGRYTLTSCSSGISEYSDGVVIVPLSD